jgi:hypothetical protein
MSAYSFNTFSQSQRASQPEQHILCHVDLIIDNDLMITNASDSNNNSEEQMDVVAGVDFIVHEIVQHFYQK